MLVHIVRDSQELGNVQVVGKCLALLGGPFRGTGLVAVSFLFK